MSDEEKCFGDVLEKNYSPKTSEEEKIVIHTIIRNLEFIFNQNIVDNDSMFSKERGPKNVRDLMTAFNKWKFVIKTHPNTLGYLMDNPRSVIYKIARLCFHYWIRDSQIISEVLSHVYHFDGHFCNMVDHILYQNERRLNWPAVANQETEQKEYLINLYFLTHAHIAKLEFSGVRFADLGPRGPPVLWAALNERPQLILLLLRHGAIVQQVSWNLHMLLRHLIMKLWYSLGTETEESSWDTTDTSSAVNDVSQCLIFLLRGIRQIPIGALEFKFKQSNLPITRNSHDFILAVSEKGIVPTLMSRYLEPSGLRHLCRLAIRDALHRNWNLPFGVFSLPLPKVLQRYVNLSED